MSKHVGRKQRWTQAGPNRHTSDLGSVVYEKGAWFATLEYRLRTGPPEGPPVWEPHARRLGPYKRPRNAMVALEREAVFLKNRHGGDALLGGDVWAEV